MNLLEILDLQLRLKDSLDMTWKNSLSHDWIPVEKAKTFPLREFYVGLRWVRVVKRAIKNFKQELKSIYDILEIVDITGRPKAINILVTGSFVIHFNSIITKRHLKHTKYKNFKYKSFVLSGTRNG